MSVIYNFRLVNVTLVATTKKRAIKHTQKEMRKECKHFTRKKSKTIMQEMRDKETIRHLQNK